MQVGRVNSSQGAKRSVVGHPASHIAPSRRVSGGISTAPAAMTRGRVASSSGEAVGSGSGAEAATGETGSKIFISRLPVDVTDSELEDLFRKTVGPVKETFLVCNSQGNSKGMAVVSFHRPGDALVAHAKYDARVIDGRRPIKIEFIVEQLSPTQTTTGAAKASEPRSLLQRLAPAPKSTTTTPATTSLSMIDRVGPKRTLPPIQRRPRQRKGPKRLNKRPATVRDLDQEMDDYRRHGGL